MGSFDCCPGDDFECVRAFSDLDGLVDFEVTKGLRGFACWPGDGELSDAGRVEETEGFDKAVATETRVVADSAVNGDGGIVGGLAVNAVNLNPGAERSAVGFRANEFDLEPVATMAGVLEERVERNLTVDLPSLVPSPLAAALFPCLLREAGRSDCAD